MKQLLRSEIHAVRDLDSRCKKLMKENEAKAIVVAGKMECVLAAVYILTGLLVALNIYIKGTPTIYICLFASGLVMTLLALPAFRKTGKNIWWLKYVSFFMLTMTVWVINIVTGYKVWLLYSIPILFSIRFYNRRFTHIVTGFSMLFGVASVFTNAYLSPYTRIMDLNLVSFSEPGTLSYYSWLHNAVLNHGYDAHRILVNGFRLSLLPNCLVFFLIFFASDSIINNALRMLIRESESHVGEIKSLNQTLSKITAGNFDTKEDVLGSLSESNMSDEFYDTVDKLNALLAHADERRSKMKDLVLSAEARKKTDLEIAKTIQLSVLPTKFPPYPDRKDFDIYACTFPAKDVGGDFYDLYLLGEDRLAFLIADVSGKGIPAAMFMMNAKSVIKGLTESGLSLAEVFTETNNKLCESNEAEMFVTAWMGILHLNTGNVEYISAGHNPPLVRHKDGSFGYFRSKVGLVLAGMEGTKYRTSEFKLMPGDEIYLYTDGVTEAVNSERKMYKEERLCNLLNEKPCETAEDVCKEVKKSLDAFMGEADQFDDITMLSLKYAGREQGVKSLQVMAKIEFFEDIKNFVTNELQNMNCGRTAYRQIIMSIDELFTNIVDYAYPNGAGQVTVHLLVENNVLNLTFEDNGIQFNPLNLKEPDVTLGTEDREIGGLGVYMVKKTMDSVSYEHKGGKNIVKLKKSIASQE